MVKRLILAALLVGVASLAGAQRAQDSAPALYIDPVVADLPVAESALRADGVHLDFPDVTAFQKQIAGGPEPRRWLEPASFRIPSARFAARPNTGAPAVRSKISRTFVAIPMLRWQRYSSLVTPRGFVAVAPSLVIGRRLTWAPELARGGRTIGLAVQVRMWLDKPASPAGAAPPAQASDRLLSTVRSMLGR